MLSALSAFDTPGRGTFCNISYEKLVESLKESTYHFVAKPFSNMHAGGIVNTNTKKIVKGDFFPIGCVKDLMLCCVKELI